MDNLPRMGRIVKNKALRRGVTGPSYPPFSKSYAPIVNKCSTAGIVDNVDYFSDNMECATSTMVPAPIVINRSLGEIFFSKKFLISSNVGK